MGYDGGVGEGEGADHSLLRLQIQNRGNSGHTKRGKKVLQKFKKYFEHR